MVKNSGVWMGADAVLLNSLFSPVGANRYLRRIIGRNDITGSIFQFRLQFGSDTTESAPASGDDLVQPWETRADDAIIIEQGTHTFDISGPGHGLNDASDLSEPYAWSPPFADQTALSIFFFTELDTSADWYLTLRTAGNLIGDDPENALLEEEVTAGNPTVTGDLTVVIVDIENAQVSGEVTAGSPSSNGDLTVIEVEDAQVSGEVTAGISSAIGDLSVVGGELTLSDFDSTGLVVDVFSFNCCGWR